MTVSARYFFRSQRASSRHKDRVPLYLVETLTGSRVVARITPLGLVKEYVVEEMANLEAIRLRVTPTGGWRDTRSGHHRRLQVVAQ